jgi:UDP-glucose 4-epimerase
LKRRPGKRFRAKSWRVVRGDAAEVYGATQKAFEVLGWRAERTIEDCCIDQWKWASANPYGYMGKPDDE